MEDSEEKEKQEKATGHVSSVFPASFWQLSRRQMEDVEDVEEALTQLINMISCLEGSQRLFLQPARRLSLLTYLLTYLQ